MEVKMSKLVLITVIILAMLFFSGYVRDIQNNPGQSDADQRVNHIDNVESDKEPGRINEEVIGIAKFQSKVAIITKDTVRKNSYSILTEGQFDKVPDRIIHYDADGNAYYISYDSDYVPEGFTVPVSKNDIVLVIGEDGDYYRITYAHGDVPRPIGYTPKEAISFDERLFENANQGRIIDAMTYNSIDGRELGLRSGTGMVERRENGWIQLAFPSGEEPFWIRRESLRFDLAQEVLDKITRQKED
jgi:hypothetical protein